MSRLPPAAAPGRRRLLGGALAALSAGALAVGPASAGAVTVVPANLYVSTAATSDPACADASQANPFATLAGAIACAHKGDIIHLGPGTFHGEVTIPFALTLIGAGPATVITGSTDVSDSKPAIRVADDRSASLKSLTVDGVDQNAQGIVSGSGNLTLTDVTVHNAGAHGHFGAGIDVTPKRGAATVKVIDSTIADNAAGTAGGGIHVTSASTTPSTLTVTDSTITGNDGEVMGGAVYLQLASLVAREDTITDNVAESGGGIQKDSSPGTVSLQNTILAGNHGPPPPATPAADVDCSGLAAKFVDAGHNVVGVGCGSFIDTANGDRIGTPAQPLDPRLGALADNGGPTETRAPQLGSPALNAGDASACNGTPDQRGLSRHADTRFVCDVGAVDTGGTPLQTLPVSAKAASNPSCAIASSTHPFKTIPAALACAENGTTVKIGAGTFPGPIEVDHDVTLVGNGAGTVITGSPSPADITPDVTVGPRSEAILKDLVVDGVDQTAPGVVAHSGRLTLIADTVKRGGSNGQNPPRAGGLSVVPDPGSASETTVIGSTIDHNVAPITGGGILVRPVDQGAILNPPSSLTILNSTVADNAAQSGDGGGLWVGETGLTLRDSPVAGNSASGNGGGIRGGTENGLHLVNTILAGNTAFHGSDCSSTRPSPAPSGGHNVIGQIGPDSGAGRPAFAAHGGGGGQARAAA